MSKPNPTVRNQKIVAAYESGHFTTERIAEAFGLKRRRVLQIVKAAGVVRTRAEGNRVAAPLKRKHRLHI